MALYTETGTVKVLNAEQSGTSKAGNAWTAREFVIETTDDGIVNNLHFKAFGRECEVLRDVKIGETVTVTFKPMAREYGGRWYDELKLYGVKIVREEPAPAPTPETVQNDLPF